ncbi:unnamed protein product [Microthlaspi erraticum]|uniref:Uncharacterized protein n=1 Tax=Microthlaspi erraticum TaxID=1685480 RepID=A0A6D2J835_9BRAS|nr:unnamed protein product [Microthlaspi erraticum]
MEAPAKGTVTPIASLFSEEEARKAASYVEEKIGAKRGEMNRLQQFVDENANLINLVAKLPDQLHHNVMVPFGKMAFFPGRLIHTNECLVLLGENYYSDRTSKQTIDILSRRDKTIQSQIRSLKAEIDDFQTEASFFTTTASEAAEGLVEIREEFEEEEEEEEDSSATLLQSGVKEPSGLPGGETAEDEVEDDEFARIMSRLNELEMQEEQEGEDGDGRGEKHDSPIESELDTVKGIRGETNKKQETTLSVPKNASIGESRYSEPRVRSKVIEVLPEKHPHEDQSRGGIDQQNAETWKDFQATSRAKAKTDVVASRKIEVQSPIQQPEPKFDANKAFTGSIVEHALNLETNLHGQKQSSVSQPSKPVSRFKAQRR